MTRGAEGCRSKCAQNHLEGFFFSYIIILVVKLLFPGTKGHSEK